VRNSRQNIELCSRSASLDGFTPSTTKVTGSVLGPNSITGPAVVRASALLDGTTAPVCRGTGFAKREAAAPFKRCGGAGRSELWRRLVLDVLIRPMVVVACDKCSPEVRPGLKSVQRSHRYEIAVGTNKWNVGCNARVLILPSKSQIPPNVIADIGICQ
jgi:hypothetical protein